MALTMNRLSVFRLVGGCLWQSAYFDRVNELLEQMEVAPDGIYVDAERAVWGGLRACRAARTGGRRMPARRHVYLKDRAGPLQAAALIWRMEVGSGGATELSGPAAELAGFGGNSNLFAFLDEEGHTDFEAGFEGGRFGDAAAGGVAAHARVR